MAAHGGVGRAVLAAGVLVVVRCGSSRHGPWLPARIASLFFLGLSVGTLGGAVTAVV